MTSDDHANAVFYALAMILPLSALIARRMPLRRSLALGGIWLAIFLVAMAVVGLTRDRAMPLRQNLTSLFGDDEQRIVGGAVRLRAAPDGHFWADVQLNGVRGRMLIDSGATTTSLSLATARAAGIDAGESGIPVPIHTANGLVMAHTSSVDRLTLGPITVTNLRVVVASEFGDIDVLGMNFLSRLRSWRVERGILILQP